MKNILIPTDFSSVSLNAAEYAISLAKEVNAKVTLLHVYHIPVAPVDSIVALPSLSELDKLNNTVLKDFKNKLKEKCHFTENIRCIVKAGFLNDEMKDVVLEENIDLIIMGITGAGKLSEVVMGSNTTSAIKNSDCPVLVVPANSKYKKINNIAFACDLEKVKNAPAITLIKTWLQKLKANLFVLNMVSSTVIPTFNNAIEGMKLSSIFEGFKHSLYFPENEDLTITLNDFVDQHKIDLLVMIPRKHNFFADLFKESNTKRMAFHTHIPLLAIHD